MLLKSIYKVVGILLLLHVFCVNGYSLNSVSAPSLTCVSVLTNGDVDLTWEQSNDPSGVFIEYKIYCSFGGAFVLVGVEPNILTTTFTHLGANGQASFNQYYVASSFGPSTDEISSDTITNILVTSTNPNNGTAVLTWNDQSSVASTFLDDWYLVYKEYPIGNWELIDSVSFNNPNLYIDTITTCNDSLTYKVVLRNDLGCDNVSSSSGDYFFNQIPPSAPEIVSVSIDTSSNTAFVVWSPSESGDTEGYILFQQDANENWFILDTIYGYLNNFYYNNLSNAGNGSEVYGLAAFDSCWSGTPLSPNTSPIGIEHNTLYLEKDYNVCNSEVELTWNSYVNWKVGVSFYEVYVSENGGAYFMLSNTGVQTSFVHSDLNPNSDYCYVIRASTVGGVYSLSNKLCFTASQPTQPAYVYLQTATVVNNEYVRLKINADPSASVVGYEIYRKDVINDAYSYLGVVSPGSGVVQYKDYSAPLTSKSSYYQVVTIDSCGRTSVMSNELRTMHLIVTSNQNSLKNLIQWNRFNGWNGAVKEYAVYRSVNGLVESTPLFNLGNGATFYEDNVSNLIGRNSDGEICYHIVAIEQFNSYGFQESAASNSECVVMTPLVFVPNALVIGGYNSTIVPVGNFINATDYLFRIHARNGVQVFNSQEKNKAWDGYFNGKVCPLGVYVYVLSYRDGAGVFHEKKGHITLVR